MVDIGTTTFTFHRQTIELDKDIVSTSGTISADGTRFDLHNLVLETITSNLVDACTAVL